VTICRTMESENEVVMEDEKHVIGETTKVEHIHKEVEDNGSAEIEPKNEVSQPKLETNGNNSAATKNSKSSKVP